MKHGMITKTQGDVTYLSFPAFDACGAVNHCFTTRLGGVSTGEYAAMNLSYARGDAPANVLENYRRACSAAGVDYRRAVVSKQTHGVNLRVVTSADLGKGVVRPVDYTSVDGLMTNLAGVPLVTLYADCVPLLFCDPVRRAVATSHAGWRGTVAGIGGLTIAKMAEVYGCRPSDVLCGIAPSIGPCCFEVDQPVYDAFSEAFRDDIDRIAQALPTGKFRIDLWLANRLTLRAAGVPDENISTAAFCTMCRSDLFHSHRATGGRRGNTAAIISLRP